MSSGFSSCQACARHVRATDMACPFCQAVVDRVKSPVRRVADAPGSRRSRAALLAGAALAVGCSSSDPSGTAGGTGGTGDGSSGGGNGGSGRVVDSGGDSAVFAPPYGLAPIPDGGDDEGDGGVTEPADGGGDSGSTADGGVSKDGGPPVTQPVYGSSPP